MKLKGKVAKGVAAGAGRAGASRRNAKLKVVFTRIDTRARTDSPYPGAVTQRNSTPRAYWTPPVPVRAAGELLWSGRLLLGTTAARGSVLARGDDGLYEMAVSFIQSDLSADLQLVGLFIATLVPNRALAIVDGRSPGLFRPIGGGGGTAAECSDGKDNDSDGLTDAADRDCLSTMDTTERGRDLPMNHVSDGSSAIFWLTWKPFFGAWEPSFHVQQWVIYFNPDMHTSTQVNQGPQEINGEKPCDLSGTTYMVSSGRGSQAPTTSPSGTPIPEAMPDEDHMRIVVEVQDAPDGQECTGAVAARVAADTRVVP